MKTTVYSRPDCHLCEEAIESLAGLTKEFPGLEIVEIDIDSDDDLLRRYLERIPVIMIDGEIVSELVFDPEPVRDRLRIP
ncbi:MAG: glutaredoxin family protein [Solirubrobacterales bacterium]|nr:glutaredoxin family protein [Solirubrobacterales bacterium]